MMREKPMIARRAVIAMLLTLGATPALAAYPDRPVRIIVPYAPGGPADVTARLLAAKLQERLGQSFVIDNRSGAGGNIGTAAGAQAPADGYTLTVITPAQIINTTLFAKPGYELREFAPLALLNVAPALLARASQARRELGRRGDRRRQGKARRDLVREPRHRRRAAPDDGDDQEGRGHRHGACTVSRLRACA